MSSIPTAVSYLAPAYVETHNPVPGMSPEALMASLRLISNSSNQRTTRYAPPRSRSAPATRQPSSARAASPNTPK